MWLRMWYEIHSTSPCTTNSTKLLRQAPHSPEKRPSFLWEQLPGRNIPSAAQRHIGLARHMSQALFGCLFTSPVNVIVEVSWPTSIKEIVCTQHEQFGQKKMLASTIRTLYFFSVLTILLSLITLLWSKIYA